MILILLQLAVAEEMVFTTNNIFWSPDSRFLAYLVTNDTLVDKIEYSVYGDFQYPDMVNILQ